MIALPGRRREAQCEDHFLQFLFRLLQVIDDALRGGNRDTREGRLGDARLRHGVVKRSKIVGGPADNEQERVYRGSHDLRIR